MVRALGGALLAMWACGRVDFATRDGGELDSNLTSRCATWNTWSAPIRLAELSEVGPNDFGGALTEDGLLFCFASQRQPTVGANDIWCSTRTSVDVAFDPPTSVTELNTNQAEATIDLRGDGLEMFFASARVGSVGARDIYVASRASRTATYGVPMPIVSINTVDREEVESLSADGLRLYFSRVVTGVRSQMFVVARPDLASPFGAPVELTELNDVDSDEAGALSEDELDLFYGSQRAGGIGGIDVWYAHRDDPEAPFGTPVLVPELSSTLDDLPATLTRDGAALYLNYNTDRNGNLDSDTWLATRTCRDSG